MATQRTSMHGQWSSRWIFILAAAGSAIGLGNIWKFPYITGENGGGAFVLVYLLCIALIGIPIMMAEVLIGRRGRQSPIETMRTLAAEEKRTPAWRALGWMGVAAGFCILSYYSVIAGWALDYVLKAGSGAFTGQDAVTIRGMFDGLVGNAGTLLFWHTLFMILTVIVVSRGVYKGLERAVSWMMPLLFILLLVLVGYAMNTEYFIQGLHYLFTPDFSKITAAGVLAAMGHSFFTLSLGMGAIMVYGAYMPQQIPIGKSVIVVALADTAVALLAGMAIFPLVFANALEPGAGPGLVFQTLPIAFGQMPGGAIFGTIFFVLLVLAAWTSSISLVEPAVAWLVEKKKMPRVRGSILIGVISWLLGIGTVLSFNHWAEVKLFGKTFFDLIDFLAANIMLPLGGLLIAVFAGWVMRRSSTEDELALPERSYSLWRFVIRYITPVAIGVVVLNLVGVF